MSDTRVCVCANEVTGPLSDRTARLTVAGQFSLPNVGSTMLTMEYVLGQINNDNSAGFVAPARAALAAVHDGDGLPRDGAQVVALTRYLPATLRGWPAGDAGHRLPRTAAPRSAAASDR